MFLDKVVNGNVIKEVTYNSGQTVCFRQVTTTDVNEAFIHNAHHIDDWHREFLAFWKDGHWWFTYREENANNIVASQLQKETGLTIISDMRKSVIVFDTVYIPTILKGNVALLAVTDKGLLACLLKPDVPMGVQ